MGAHENLSLEDWAKEGPVNVTVSYEDDVFDAVVLQVRFDVSKIFELEHVKIVYSYVCRF